MDLRRQAPRSSRAGRAGSASRRPRRFAASGANLVLGDIEDRAAGGGGRGASRRRARSVIGAARATSRSRPTSSRLREAALGEFGGAHVVFNNAGVGGRATIGTPKNDLGLGAERQRRRRGQRHQRLRAPLPRAERGPRGQHRLAGRPGRRRPAWAPTARASSRSSDSPSRSSTSSPLRGQARGRVGALPGLRAHAHPRVERNMPERARRTTPTNPTWPRLSDADRPGRRQRRHRPRRRGAGGRGRGRREPVLDPAPPARRAGIDRAAPRVDARRPPADGFDLEPRPGPSGRCPWAGGRSASPSRATALRHAKRSVMPAT